jgi:hypothetical protein
VGNRSVDLEQYFRAIKPENYELKVVLAQDRSRAWRQRDESTPSL